MTITTKNDGTRQTIALGGRLDTVSSPELEAELTKLPEDVTELILDFNELEYISSAGLRVLLSAQKKMSAVGSMKVIGVNETVNEVFDITGFCDILTIETKED